MRAGLAALPYAEFIVVANIKSIKLADQRDAAWDIEREHIEIASPDRCLSCVTTGGYGGPPLRRGFVTRKVL